MTAFDARWCWLVPMPMSIGLELDDKFTYKDLGVSAYDRSNLERGALGLFLEAVEAGKVPKGSILLVEAFDRLTRSPR